MKQRYKIKKKRRKRYGVFEFPAHVLTEGVTVNIFDEYGCVVKNYDEIISYSENLIILTTPIGRLMLKGSELELADSDSFELKITGCVRAAEFSGV